MLKTRLILCFSLIFILSSASAHRFCSDLFCKDIATCKASAEWIVEGTITKVIDTGGNNECETAPRPVGPLCGYVPNPEKIVLSDIRFIKGSLPLKPKKHIEITRKDTCFSGALSVMNKKPELSAIGKRVRFFGSETTIPPFAQPGYFWVEFVK